MIWGVSIKHDRPHIGKILKSLREHRGISQETVAVAAHFNRSTLSQIELGNHDCSDELLNSIKLALDVDFLPLRETERPYFRSLLNKWYNAISERDWENAKEMRDKLSVIRLLPHDTEFNITFALHECRMLLPLNELDTAKAIIDELEDRFSELDVIQQYYHYFNQGSWNIRNKRNSEALAFYLKAYEIMKSGLAKNIVLYFNIALCYSRLGRFNRAIAFLEEACMLPTIGQNNISELQLFNSLGLNYARTGHLQRAKMLLDKAYTIALGNYKTNANKDTKANVGVILHNYGYTFRMSKQWNTAIEYFDKAFMYIDNETTSYLEVLYQKTRSLIEMRNHKVDSDLIEEGLFLSKSKNDEDYVTLFKGLKRLIQPNDSDIEYLETKTLPYLLQNKLNCAALDYATFLKDYYSKKGRGVKKKVSEMAHIAFNILSEMLEGGVVE